MRRVDLAIFPAASGVPVVPGAVVTRETDGWHTISRGAHRLHIFVGGVSTDGTSALCAVVGPPRAVSAVSAVASSSARGAGAVASLAAATRRRWAHWHVTGEYALTTPEGETIAVPIARRVTLPTPLPGTALPWRFGPLRVDTLVGPALPSTIAGHDDADAADTGGPETEADVGGRVAVGVTDRP
jgi:hypothetical protein